MKIYFIPRVVTSKFSRVLLGSSYLRFPPISGVGPPSHGNVVGEEFEQIHKPVKLPGLSVAQARAPYLTTGPLADVAP